MIRKMLCKLRQLFCHHNFVLFSTSEFEMPERPNHRCVLRIFKCEKCGKTDFVRTENTMMAPEIRELVEKLTKH